MAKYRAKLAVIEAIVFTDEPARLIELSEFVDDGSDWLTISYADRENPQLIIKTSEGEVRGNIGDYVVKFDDGDTYLYSADNFHKAYDLVSD